MAGGMNPKEFPDVTQKLTAPKKLSAFERERQAAAAKQQRAEAENARALKAFEESFADEDDDDFFADSGSSRRAPAGSGRNAHNEITPDRAYGRPPPGPRNGLSTVGMGSGPPPSLKRKRALDEMREAQEARRERDLYADGKTPSNNDFKSTLQDDRVEHEAPRLTVQLSSLPPMMSPDDVMSLLKPHLHVSSVHFLPPAGPGANVKRSGTAIVTLASDASLTQVESAISVLKDRYLRYGFYLSLSRNLQSVPPHPLMAGSATASFEPFAAEKHRDQHPRHSMRHAPPPSEYRGVASPDSFGNRVRPPYGSFTRTDAQVLVQPPLEIESIRAVHAVVDQLLLESDPERALEIEAMLMMRPEVQEDERFAFLYDARSPIGRYYRFLLWAPECLGEVTKEAKQRIRGPERIHGDFTIEWTPPRPQLLFLDLKSLADVVTDIDYASSEEESDDDACDRPMYSGREGDGRLADQEVKHLNPLKRARLVHLLSRLPTSSARLRKGDVARITNFAIGNAGHGAEEIVDVLLLNLERPFVYSLAAKYEDQDLEQDEEDEYVPGEDLANLGSPAPAVQTNDGSNDNDTSGAKLVGLYVISDILSASSTAGARNAWKYRQLFEAAFKVKRIFEHLGKLEKELAWGRLKAEQWRRKLGVVLGIWESWSVFPHEAQERFRTDILGPLVNADEKAAMETLAVSEANKEQEEKWMGRFRKIERDDHASNFTSPAPALESTADAEQMAHDNQGTAFEDLDGLPMEDVDGSPLDEAESHPTEDQGVDGQAMADGIGPMDREPQSSVKQRNGSEGAVPDSAVANDRVGGPRRRMKAEDMFGDSEED